MGALGRGSLAGLCVLGAAPAQQPGPIGFSYHEVAHDDDLAGLGRLERLVTRAGSLALELVVRRAQTLSPASSPTTRRRTTAVDAERIAGCFVTLVLSAADDPAQPVASLATPR